MQQFLPPITEARWTGYDDTHAPELLPSGVFQKAENVVVSDSQIMKVFGSSTIANSIASQAFNGAAPFENIASSVKYIVVNINGASNAQLYQWNGSGNFNAIGSANIANSTPMYFETANNILYGFNGTEVVSWDGTTYTHNPSSVPLGTFASWFHNYLFVARTTANPNRLFWSNLGDPTTFSGSNFVDVNPGDSDAIQGLGKFQDELLVFKRNTIWSITGFSGSSFSSTTIATQNTNGRIFGYGCIAPNSIVSIGNDVYYLSMLGSTPVIRSLYKTINAVTLGGGVITNSIKVTMDSITKSQLSIVAGTFDGRYAWWSIPTNGSTTNNKILLLDTWNIDTRRDIYPFTTMVNKNAHNLLVSTIPGYSNVYWTDEGTTGLVYKYDSSLYTDNGTNITMDVITRRFMADPSRKMKWKYLYIKFKSGVASTLNVNSRIDIGSTYINQDMINLAGQSPGLGPTGTFTLGVSQLGGGNLSSHRTTFLQQLGKMMDIEFKESSANAVSLYEYSLYMQAKGLRND